MACAKDTCEIDFFYAKQIVFYLNEIYLDLDDKLTIDKSVCSAPGGTAPESFSPNDSNIISKQCRGTLPHLYTVPVRAFTSPGYGSPTYENNIDVTTEFKLKHPNSSGFRIKFVDFDTEGDFEEVPHCFDYVKITPIATLNGAPLKDLLALEAAKIFNTEICGEIGVLDPDYSTVPMHENETFDFPDLASFTIEFHTDRSANQHRGVNIEIYEI